MKTVVLAALMGMASLGALPSFGDSSHSHCDAPEAWHEWAVLGGKSVFLTHLPMFSSIHAYQIIIEATFQNSGGAADGIYLRDRQSHPSADYTLSPGGSPETRLDYVLPDVVRNKTPFPGYLHRTNQGGGETILATNLRVVIKRVIYFHEFRGSEIKPPELSYLLFGNGAETLLAHFVSGGFDRAKAPASPDDFDQILSVETKPAAPIAEKDFFGFFVTIPGRPNGVATRLKKETVKAVVKTKSGSVPITINVNSQFHYQEKISRQN